MNDYWNDPPENPELPECCGEIMDARQDGACVCSKCGKVIMPKPDSDPPDMEPDWTSESERMVPMPAKCPHGNDWFDCAKCDLAFDADRESKA